MPFAQLVIGPPGAGKSTYCNGMHQFLGAIGRKCSIVNLDPANDKTSYPCALDVRDLVTLEDIMEEDKLGPNGGVLYALEELENNFDWLENGLKELGGMSDISWPYTFLTDLMNFQKIIFFSTVPVKWSYLRTTPHYATSSTRSRSWASELVAAEPQAQHREDPANQTPYKTVDRCPPRGLLYPHPSLNVHLRPPPLSPRHAATRPPASKRPH
jgi:hypothetical protein